MLYVQNSLKTTEVQKYKMVENARWQSFLLSFCFNVGFLDLLYSFRQCLIASGVEFLSCCVGLVPSFLL